MPKDAGITDTCYYFEDGVPHWWESPDILITGPSATGIATNPADNTVRLNVRRKGTAGNPPCNDPLGNGDADFLQLDLWVCIPNAGPIAPTSITLVQKIQHSVGAGFQEIMLGVGGAPYLAAPPAPGGEQIVDVTWKLPRNPASQHPAEGSGHKCMIARVYPNTDSPSSGTFEVIDDQHYAQRNICINVCNSPCSVDLVAGNVNNELPREFQLRVVHNPNPSRFLRETIALSLEESGIEWGEIAQRPPNAGFGLRVSDMPNIKWVRNQPPRQVTPVDFDGCRRLILMLVQQLLQMRQRDTLQRHTPTVAQAVQRQQNVLPTIMLPNSVEGTVPLAPNQIAGYRFETDLDGEPPGSTHIFHVMEIENGVVQGGVTMVMIKGA